MRFRITGTTQDGRDMTLEVNAADVADARNGAEESLGLAVRSIAPIDPPVAPPRHGSHSSAVQYVYVRDVRISFGNVFMLVLKVLIANLLLAPVALIVFVIASMFMGNVLGELLG